MPPAFVIKTNDDGFEIVTRPDQPKQTFDGLAKTQEIDLRHANTDHLRQNGTMQTLTRSILSGDGLNKPTVAQSMQICSPTAQKVVSSRIPEWNSPIQQARSSEFIAGRGSAGHTSFRSRSRSGKSRRSHNSKHRELYADAMNREAKIEAYKDLIDKECTFTPELVTKNSTLSKKSVK